MSDNDPSGTAVSNGSGTPVEDEYSTPPDLSLVQADDALLDALGGSDPKVADGFGDQELNALLLAWRRDIDSEPFPDLMDADEAATTVRTATLAKRHAAGGRRRRMLVPVAAAAAVLAIAFTGSGLAARDAQPGDTLWGLTKVLYADHARSVEAAAAVRIDLQQAQLAITQGRFDEARQALEQARLSLGEVAAEDNADVLRAQHLELSLRLNEPETPSKETPKKPSEPGVTQSPPPDETTSGGSTPTPTPAPELPPGTTTNPPPSSTSSSPPPSTTQSGDGTGTESQSGSSPRSDTDSDGAQPVAPAAP
ncbi:anti-sigma-D factor RsdA [Amycolatopsis marina]|uniref:anti-sigma-D factor RsdA n=1 Tax=Amycolatopsis marina TaxID=490629 RepID=UPI000B88144A|nr:anti-sigma-D factor RsdA [Amycolatopsis marina]